jgi:pyruvate ferredoxin oxidoreductase gamma subunit
VPPGQTASGDQNIKLRQINTAPRAPPYLALARSGISQMFQIRIHGRGGQGVVTAAAVLSVAAFLEDKHAQAFPSFGSERMGAPVVSFCRIDTKEIRLREPITAPDALIVQDVTLFKAIDVFQGLKESGYLLVNTNQSFADLHLAPLVAKLPAGHAVTVPATELALKHIGRPVPNAALLGAFAALTGMVRFESVAKAIREEFPGRIGDANIAAATEAHDAVVARVMTAA